MSLVREALALGRIPLEDPFAYTPTVHPVVHHEWGSGAILLAVFTLAGFPGFQALRLVLMGALAWQTLATARLRGATLSSFLLVGPVGITMVWMGLTAVRPQLFTLVLTAQWLWFIEQDRRGHRRWIGAALPLHALWANLHGGVVVGMCLLAMHMGERYMRGQPWRHLGWLLAAMIALLAINPYGVAYYTYLLDALTLHRDLVTEWRPLWDASLAGQTIVAMSLLIGIAAYARHGLASVPGWPLLMAATAMAIRHERHVSLYAVIWCTQVPAVIARLGWAAPIHRAIVRPSFPMRVAWAIATLGVAALLTQARPWHLDTPTYSGPPRGAQPSYPVQAVTHLQDTGFRGNLWVPFATGAYVTWRLHPAVRVSLDTRFEAAYAPALLSEHLRFYDARPGWQESLARYPTDAVLVPTDAPVGSQLIDAAGWRVRYRDEAYMVVERR